MVSFSVVLCSTAAIADRLLRLSHTLRLARGWPIRTARCSGLATACDPLLGWRLSSGTALPLLAIAQVPHESYAHPVRVGIIDLGAAVENAICVLARPDWCGAQPEPGYSSCYALFAVINHIRPMRRLSLAVRSSPLRNIARTVNMDIAIAMHCYRHIPSCPPSDVFLSLREINLGIHDAVPECVLAGVVMRP